MVSDPPPRTSGYAIASVCRVASYCQSSIETVFVYVAPMMRQ